ncbi:MAG TPA: diguanylate cyclase [Bryobacteraceae bacterium]|jgi:GGDEF domain-containing protein|nr:diguanylate cyclase [Bryobacteraceae bacterium]
MRFSRGHDAPLTQVVSLLLEKLISGAVIADDDEYAAFRADINRMQGFVRQDPSPEKIVFTAGSATLVMEAYNKSITDTVRKERRELKNIVNMLTETVAAIAGENTKSVERLRDIRSLLESRGAADLEALKQQVGECLRVFREETMRQREEAESEMMALRREIELGARPLATPELHPLDPATNLPPKDACVVAMHEPIPPGKRRYVVVMVVNRLQAINARFGYEVGSRVLRHFGEFIQQQLRPEDRLFRWRGPSLVALLESSEPLDQIRNRIRRIMELRVEQTLDIEGRSVMIPVSAAWSAFQIITTVAAAEKQIEIFTASQSSHEYV